MDDIAPELYERLKAEYERRRGSAAEAAEKAKGYRDVLSWADHAGRSAALTFDGILPEELPDGMMYFNIAERTLRPVLEEVAADVLTVAKAAQETLNAAAGIEMAFQAPDEEDKIKGLVDLVCAGTWEAQQDDFCAATQTYASKVSDDCIRQNAGSQYDAGMDPKIIRTAGAGACVWCSELAGTYDYEKVRRGSEVFSRHVNCNCVVEYEPRKGRRQNVHSKEWRDGTGENRFVRDSIRERGRGHVEQSTRNYTHGNVTLSAYRPNIETRHEIWIDDQVQMSDIQIRALDRRISESREIMGMPDTYSARFVVTERGYSKREPAATNVSTKTVFVKPGLAGEEFYRLQSDGVFPDDPHSTFIHELFHIKDAYDYEGQGLVIDSGAKGSEYIKYLDGRAWDALLEQGYDLLNPGDVYRKLGGLSSDFLVYNEFDELYTEHRTKEVILRSKR